MARNRVIGVQNGLPWHIPEDLKYFREMTKGKVIIMGRKTFESFGSKPLPLRLNLIVSRRADFQPEGAKAFTTIEQALEFAKLQIVEGQYPPEIMICGGEEIYRQTLPITDRIYLTVIDQDYQGDAKFPEFDQTQFQLTKRIDRDLPVRFSFCIYDRV